MDTAIVFSKTAKGLHELNSSNSELTRSQIKALTLIDGRSTVAELAENLNKVAPEKFFAALSILLNQDCIRVFQVDSTQTKPETTITPSGLTVDQNDAVKFTPSWHTLEATELSAEESVQAWAEARRGAEKLETEGFYTYAGNRPQPGNPSGRLTILVVEDDPLIADLLALHLTQKAFKVLKAATIPEALTILQGSAKPDMLLLDVVLPGLPGKDGFHILNTVRRTPGLRDLPVIMITSQVSDEQVMRGLRANADGYIFKPFQWETVYRSIQGVIRIQQNR